MEGINVNLDPAAFAEKITEMQKETGTVFTCVFMGFCIVLVSLVGYWAARVLQALKSEKGTSDGSLKRTKQGERK